MDIIGVSYALIKSEAIAKGLKYFYVEAFLDDGVTEAGYAIFAMGTNYGLTVNISNAIDPANVTDFNANIKPTAISVGSQAEAMAQSSLAQVSSIILPGANSGRSFGYTGTNAVASKTVRALIYTPPGNNAQRSIVSTNAADTAAGTGTRTIKITYMAADGSGPFTETVTLNGLTAVNTVGVNIALIEKMEVLTVGSGGGNAGTINLMTGIGGAGTVIGSIAPGDNQTNWAHHYVPLGKTCYVLLIEGAATVAAGGLSINALNPINANVAQTQPDITIRHGTIHVSRPYIIPLAVVGPAIIFVNERPDVVTVSTVFAGFHWIQA